MKQTLLNSAAALALAAALGSSAALAADNDVSQYGPANLAAQDFLNGSENGNGTGNVLFTGNDNDYIDLDVLGTGNDNLNNNGTNNVIDSANDDDYVDLDVNDAANGSLNSNGSHNKASSGNDNDYVDVDADVRDAYNDKSNDDNDGLDLDLYAKDIYNDKSIYNENNRYEHSESHALSIENVALVVSSQYLEGLSAAVSMEAGHGDIRTGGVSYGEGANSMAAGNMTTSNNTGAGTIAQSAAGIQANGTFRVGR